MKKLLFIALFLIVVAGQLVAQTYTVSGYVIDESTGETMIGVNVMVKDLAVGASTDNNGYFRIFGLTAGEYILEISYIGYRKKELPLTITDKSIVLDDIPLEPEPIEMEDIVVTETQTEITNIKVETGFREISPKAVQSIPASKGDVFRAVKYLPGVEGMDPFSPLYSVRGSETGENHILLDGVTIYNPYHYTTATGLFNLYAIKNIEMLVGGFGAEYGGRNSSVLYITTREGNNKKLHGEVETSTSQSRIIFDFPVGKNATMMVSTRTYYDLISRFLFYLPNYFYDFNASLSWKLNSRNRLSLRYFRSHDTFDYKFSRFATYFKSSFDTDVFDDYDVNMVNKWNNQAATAILKTVISPNIYLKTQVAGSFFSSNNISKIDFEYIDDETGDKTKLFYKTGINNEIDDISAKSVLNIKLNSYQTVNLGGEYNSYNFSNDIRINNFSEGRSTRNPTLSVGFIENIFDAGPLTIRAGLRYSDFSYYNKAFHEPRASSVVRLPGGYRVRAAWGRYYQFINSINSNDYEMSQYLDYYYPLKDKRPSESEHFIVGFEKAVSDKSTLSLDLYYKDISRVYTFDYNASMTDVFSFTDKIKNGSGKSVGMELMWKGTWNTFAGWLSYGLSKSTRTYPHIMNGKSFLFDYDRTHSFKAVVNHQILPTLSYSGTLLVMSGVPKTLERSISRYFYYDPGSDEVWTYPSYIADIKNNIRMPFEVRLDFGIRKKIRKGFGAELAQFLGAEESFLNVTLGNLLFLFRRNVWFYIPTDEGEYFGVGSNYFPEFSTGYAIKF